MRKTYLKLDSCSSWSIVVEDEREFTDSGNDRTKGMMKFRLLHPSLLDSTLPDDQLGDASLCDLFTGARIASIDGALAELRR
jgi:hypothetical protein